MLSPLLSKDSSFKVSELSGSVYIFDFLSCKYRLFSLGKRQSACFRNFPGSRGSGGVGRIVQDSEDAHEYKKKTQKKNCGFRSSGS